MKGQICMTCGEDKPLDQYQETRNGIRRKCKQCRNAYKTAYYRANKDRKRSVAKIWEAANRERLSVKQAAYRRANRERLAIQGAARKFGVTAEQYLDLIDLQGGRCAICGSSDSGRSNQTRLSLDHDHGCCPSGEKTCGKCIRGLLCNSCNMGLGFFRDDPVRLLAAVAYLLRRTDVLGSVIDE